MVEPADTKQQLEYSTSLRTHYTQLHQRLVKNYKEPPAVIRMKKASSMTGLDRKLQQEILQSDCLTKRFLRSMR
jgi:hypothetical protein